MCGSCCFALFVPCEDCVWNQRKRSGSARRLQISVAQKELRWRGILSRATWQNGRPKTLQTQQERLQCKLAVEHCGINRHFVWRENVFVFAAHDWDQAFVGACFVAASSSSTFTQYSISWLDNVPHLHLDSTSCSRMPRYFVTSKLLELRF